MKRACLLLLSYCLSFSVYASLTLPVLDETELTSEAKSFNKQIAELPDLHFLDKQEQDQVNQLLSDVLETQAEHVQKFRQAIQQYQEQPSLEDNWQRVELLYQSLVSLSKNKQQLLTLSSHDVRELVVGFGPSGVLQFQFELELSTLNLQYFIFNQLRAFKVFVKDFFISPVPVFSVLLKVLFVFMALMWWFRHSKPMLVRLREKMNSSAMGPSLSLRVIWYISRAQRPIAWLIAITLSLRILATLPSLQHLVFLEIFTWWILGGSIAVSFILELAYQHSRKLSADLVALRLTTIRFYVWGFITTGLISQISAMTLGKATIYAWISSVIFLFYLLITIYSLQKWRSYIFGCFNNNMQPPPLVRWAQKSRNKWFLKTISTAIAGIWLLMRNIQQWMITLLSRYQLFSHALAYLFRIEVAKQTDLDNKNSDFTLIEGKRTFDYVQPGSEHSLLIEQYGAEELQDLGSFLHSDKPALCVLSGERGIGTTTMLRRLLHNVDNAQGVYIECNNDSYESLLANIAEQLAVKESSEKAILTHLQNSSEPYLFAIDNVQRLVKPQVGGLALLMRLTNFLRLMRRRHRVVIAIEKSCWRFVDRARGERLLFDLVTFMPRWKESQINELMQSRVSEQGEFAISFEGLALPRQWDKGDLSEEERARDGYYRILWDYSDGNPTVALRFFRRSLFEDKQGKVKVRLFVIPSSEGLEKMPKPMLAVLRSIVQLELASPEELKECTQLSMAEVNSTLCYFRSRGYIEWVEGQSRISDLWFRNITNILHRQHLLVK